MYRIVTYNPQRPVKASFYIQSKGLHSGRPLVDPIPNCFAVTTELPYLKELVYALYTARKFEHFIIGTVVPFIHLGNVKMLLDESLRCYTPDKEKIFKQIRTVDELLKNTESKLDKVKQLKQAFAMQVLK